MTMFVESLAWNGANGEKEPPTAVSVPSSPAGPGTGLGLTGGLGHWSDKRQSCHPGGGPDGQTARPFSHAAWPRLPGSQRGLVPAVTCPPRSWTLSGHGQLWELFPPRLPLTFAIHPGGGVWTEVAPPACPRHSSQRVQAQMAPLTQHGPWSASPSPSERAELAWGGQ